MYSKTKSDFRNGDIFDPTPYENEYDEYEVEWCPICGKRIEADDRVMWIDLGGYDRVVHENCAIFKKEGLSWFMDMLMIDTNTGKAKDFYE